MEDYAAAGEWDYEDEYGDDDDELVSEHFIPVREGASIFEIYTECLEPTFYSAFDQMVWLLCSCLLFRILILLCLSCKLEIIEGLTRYFMKMTHRAKNG
jgi:hypothetical protein